MDKTIWKYEIPVKERYDIEIPENAQFLDVQNQNDNITMWFLLHPHSATVKRYFSVYVTGGAIPENPGKYLGTVQLGWFVAHVFEDENT